MSAAGQTTKTRLLFITRKWPPATGGMETYSFQFAAAAERMADVRKYCLPGRISGRPPGAISIIGFGVQTAVKLLFSSEAFERTHGGDLALWPLIWIARLKGHYGRLSIAVHGSDIGLASRLGVLGRLYRLYLKLAVSLLKDVRLVANSRATASLCREMGFGCVEIVPLRVRPAEPPEIRSVAFDPPYILFVGRLIRRKGCAWFIRRVMPLLDAKLTLKVASTRGEADEMEALNGPKVEYLGPVYGEALLELRRNALAVIIPNIDLGPDSFEGFGLTASEAAASGTVTLVSDLDGLPDAVEDGETGFLIPAGDEAVWARKLMEIAGWTDQTRVTYLAGVRKKVLEQGDWSDIVWRTLRLDEEQSPAMKSRT